MESNDHILTVVDPMEEETMFVMKCTEACDSLKLGRDEHLHFIVTQLRPGEYAEYKWFLSLGPSSVRFVAHCAILCT